MRSYILLFCLALSGCAASMFKIGNSKINETIMQCINVGDNCTPLEREHISKRSVYVGMDEEKARWSWGAPTKIDRHYSKHGMSAWYWYRRMGGSLAALHIVNGKVESISN